MSGLFDTFNIVKRGMATQQTALQVVSHNIANANTDGYSVQRANIKATEPFGMPSLSTATQVGQLGTGSTVASIDRSRDEFLDTQIRKEDSTLGKYDIRGQFLSDVETIFNDTSNTGLQSVLDNFWDSWQQLSTNPEPDSTARTLVLQNAEALTTEINQDYEKLQNLEANAGDLIQQQVYDVNNTLNQIDDLNKQIKAVKVSGETPNDLYDSRDLLLDKLSKEFNFNISKDDFDGVTVKGLVDGTNNEVDLVDSSGANTGVVSYLEDIKDDGSGNYTATVAVGGDLNNIKQIALSSDEVSQYKNDDGTYKFKTVLYNEGTNGSADTIEAANFTSGSLNGLNTISTEIESYKKDLNNLAKTLAVSVNTIHSGTTDSSDTSKVNFFNVEAETSDEPANVIKVAISNPDDINAGNLIGTVNGKTSGEGNGDRATMIGQLRNIVMDVLDIANPEPAGTNPRDVFMNVLNSADSTNGINLNDTSTFTLKNTSTGETLDSYYKNIVTAVGVSSQESTRMVTNQNALLSQLESKRDSVSGVSIDEEITNMIQYQRAYEANAKMVSVIDNLLDVVVNGLIK